MFLLLVIIVKVLGEMSNVQLVFGFREKKGLQIAHNAFLRENARLRATFFWSRNW